MRLKACTYCLFVAVLLFLIVPFGALGQTNRKVNLSEELTFVPLPNEKVFVHTDRDLYLPGEFLWYRLYLVDDQQHQPSGLSKVAYVELLKGKNPVLQQSIQIKDGMGSGSFYLPISLESGNYTLRAYTNWMKNEGPGRFFTKEIKIVNTLQAAFIPTEPEADYTISLFPEGGHLVKGLESTVAVWVRDQQGRGAGFTGVLMHKTDTLQNFSSHLFGMGQFRFKPDSLASHYQVWISIADSSYRVSLPSIEEQGVVMQVEDEGENLRIKVRCNPPALVPSVYLLAHTRKQLKHAGQVELPLGKGELLLPKTLLGQGVSCLTVLNKNRNAYSERLFFIPPSGNLELQALLSSKTLGIRDSLNINIQGLPTTKPAHLSLAVYQKNALQEEPEEHLISSFWLSSDLQGSIESPAFYFSGSGSQLKEQANLLMLTQGWRTFKWDSILRSPSDDFTHLPEYEGAVIQARISGVDSTSSEAQVLLSIPGRHFKMAHSHIGDKGSLLFVTRDIFGPSRLLLQPYSIPGNGYRFEINSPYSDEFGTAQPGTLYLSPEYGNLLEERSLSMQVENIYTGEQRNTFQSDLSDSLPFYGVADKSYLLDDYTRFPTMQEVMTEYVPEVAIRRQNDKPVFRVFHNRETGFYHEEPLILLDGIAIRNTERLLKADPLKIRRMDIVQDRFVFGQKPYYGVVSYTTYRGDTEWWEPDERNWETEYQGLAEQRIFYAPDYAGNSLESRTPDLRTLLYWQPDIVLEQGNARVKLHTSDVSGDFIGILQGIAPDGSMGYSIFEFTVKQAP